MSENRIADLQNMVDADPENELAHFSLGRALFDGERYAEAAREFQKTIDLNGTMSTAYSLLGLSLKNTGDSPGAIEVLTKGHAIAAERGDNMPRDEMAAQLESLGVTVETPTASPPPQGDGSFRCTRCKQPNEQLEKPPLNDELGKRIADQICQPCWKEWLGQGIKVINEFRLNLSDPAAQQEYDNHLKAFLNL